MVSKAIGGVAPLGWISTPEKILIDQALNDYEVVWQLLAIPMLFTQHLLPSW
jgi:hypothetical protein